MSTIDTNAGTIHYEATGPEDGRPVVFVHGYMMGGQLWRQVGERLADLGLRCIAPTWPLGAHPQPLRPGADRTITGVAGIVADVLSALDLDDVVLVGNDTGGSSRNSSRCTTQSGWARWCSRVAMPSNTSRRRSSSR